MNTKEKIPLCFPLRFNEKEAEQFAEDIKALRIKNRNAYIKLKLFSKANGTDIKAQTETGKQTIESLITKEEIYHLNKIGVNLNQITKRVNQDKLGGFTADDKAMLLRLETLLKEHINKRTA